MNDGTTDYNDTQCSQQLPDCIEDATVVKETPGVLGSEDEVDDDDDMGRQQPPLKTVTNVSRRGKAKLAHPTPAIGVGPPPVKQRAVSKKQATLNLAYSTERPKGEFNLSRFLAEEGVPFNSKVLEQYRLAMPSGFFQKDVNELIKTVTHERLTQLKDLATHRNIISCLGTHGARLYGDWIEEQTTEDQRMERQHSHPDHNAAGLLRRHPKVKYRDPLQLPEVVIMLGDGVTMSWDRSNFNGYVTFSKFSRPDVSHAERRQGVFNKPMEKYQTRVPLSALSTLITAATTLRHYLERLAGLDFDEWLAKKDADRQRELVTRQSQADFDYSFMQNPQQ